MGSIFFWTVAVALSVAVGGLMIAALGRTRGPTSQAAFDVQVYRDQLKEVDRDLGRGVISEDEAARLRTDIGRRLLAADTDMQSEQTHADGPAPMMTGAVIFGVMIAVAFGTYLYLGSPTAGDLPFAARLEHAAELRANRPSQEDLETELAAARPKAPVNSDPQHDQLMEQLRRVVEARPNDLQGQELLARNEAMLGNFAAAGKAQAMVVRIKAEAATAQDLALQAEFLILATGGRVSAEAEAALAVALQLDPKNSSARYYSGLMFLQLDRPDMAFRFWAPLWEESRPSDPWVGALETQLPDVAWLAGQHRYQLPPLGTPAPGPDAAAISAAEDMTPEDRQAMIQGMVDGLMARLAAEGGSAEEWARLIRALGVLGDDARARSIWAEAQERFKDRSADLSQINAAAAEAGL